MRCAAWRRIAWRSDSGCDGAKTGRERVLIIDNETVARLLRMEDCIRVQEAAFRQLPEGGAIHRPRIDMYFPAEREDGYFRWG